MHVRPMDKKDVITVAAWLAGAVIWAWLACDNFSQGRTVWTVIQMIICVGFAINALVTYIRTKK